MREDSSESRYGSAVSRWAGVGPYFAMFPVGFATDVVKEHTRRGDCIFDPFAGRATSLFAAASEARFGLGIEINPVGWIYGKAKLQTADFHSVEERIQWLGSKAHYFAALAKQLPPFFHSCFCPEVQRFLLAARTLLDWRRRKTDWTTMALLMVDLHGKRQNALSNQMRQTKSMSPRYAIKWWSKHKLKPPQRDPVAFMLRKATWRYAKGRLETSLGRIYLGDARAVLMRCVSHFTKARLLLTSPPYYGITNYFYDQWLRLWLLGGTNTPRSAGEPCKRKFENKDHYSSMLRGVFERSKPLLKPSAVVYVRTDARRFTREATIEALETAFPEKKLRRELYSAPKFTQTTLFHPGAGRGGEIDYVMW